MITHDHIVITIKLATITLRIVSDREMIGDHYPFTLSQKKEMGGKYEHMKKEGKNRWKKTHHVTFFIYHTTYIPLNNNTYNIITPHCA